MKTKLCIPVTADTTEKALLELRHAEKIADIVELRLDLIRDIDETGLKLLIEKKKKQVKRTNRPKKEGGKYEGSEKNHW